MPFHVMTPTSLFFHGFSRSREGMPEDDDASRPSRTRGRYPDTLGRCRVHGELRARTARVIRFGAGSDFRFSQREGAGTPTSRRLLARREDGLLRRGQGGVTPAIQARPMEGKMAGSTLSCAARRFLSWESNGICGSHTMMATKAGMFIEPSVFSQSRL